MVSLMSQHQQMKQRVLSPIKTEETMLQEPSYSKRFKSVSDAEIQDLKEEDSQKPQNLTLSGD